jgi:hypothetical protein
MYWSQEKIITLFVFSAYSAEAVKYVAPACGFSRQTLQPRQKKEITPLIAIGFGFDAAGHAGTANTTSTA